MLCIYFLLLSQKVDTENFPILSCFGPDDPQALFQSSWFCDSMVWGRDNKLLTCKSKRDLNLPRIQIQPPDKLLLRRAVLAYHREEFQEHSFSKFTDFDKWGWKKWWPSSAGMKVHWPCTLELLCNSNSKCLENCSEISRGKYSLQVCWVST